ncbi:acriflavin resistance protein [Pirellula staleyi DSM 6068]|uniref:Acriflavin resistance protein n=1 Tax=Pirellula staleyi (strain ATCC 27377 / DSM 6068 / ICPB 4128) TaxID=530564 RepID=D2QZ46_PIRSD|nr:efflux RND transporter permease subunit [Pirellula staleyi]ADB18238.1 acriflavin resistance protein [Pirellula staleyi DSM 6068]
MNLIEAFVHNPVKVTVGVILIVMFGIISAFNMPMQLTPEVEIPTLTIETTWPGASAAEVEREIVQEQEEQLKSVEGVRKMSSESMDSLGRVVLEFPVGTDMAEALLKVNTKLAQVPSYPEDANEPVINTSNASDRPIAYFILSQRIPTKEDVEQYAKQFPHLKSKLDEVYKAKNDALKMYRLSQIAETDAGLKAALPPEKDITTLRRFSEDFIEAALERVPGCSNANVVGGREEEVQVVVDPLKLAARGLSISDVRESLRGQNADTSGGDFWEGKRRNVIRTLGQYTSTEQVESTILARRDGMPVYVRDVGYAVESFKKPDGFVRRFGTRSISINAQRAVGSNVLEVMNGLRKTVDNLNSGVLKERGLQLVQVYDESEYIYSSVSLVTDNLLWGSLFTFLTLLLFLRSARSTVIIFMHILVSTIGAFLVMSLLGRSLNVPALGGLAFAVGMLVDNAIVMLENIYRRHQNGESPEEAAVRGASEVWGALLNATLANLAVFIPVLFIREEAGQMFRDIAIAISGAVALSMLVAVAVVPTAAMRILKPHTAKSRRQAAGEQFEIDEARGIWRLYAIAGRLVNHYLLGPLDVVAAIFVNGVVSINRTLQGSVILRVGMIGGVLAASLILTWAMMPKVEYLPNGNRNLIITLVLPPPGYNLDRLQEMGQIVENELKPYWDVNIDDPEVLKRDVPAISDFFFIARNRSVFIGVRAADPARVAELIPVIQKIAPKLDGSILVAKQASLFEKGISAGRTIEVEISGPDIDRLIEIGSDIMVDLKGTPDKPGLLAAAQVKPNPSLDKANPEVHVIPKWDQAADLNVTASELGYTVDALVDGAYATDYYLGGDKIDLRIVGQVEYASRIQDIKSLPIATASGQVIPLEAVAEVVNSSGPEQINRRTRQRAITLEVTPPAEMPLEAAMDLINEKVVAPRLSNGDLSGGYRIELAGTADKLRSTWASLRWNLMLAVLITYLLMAATFESWLYPLVVILTVPLGAVGGFIGLWLLNFYVLQPLDVLTMLGFIMLVGTVVNNPILIVEQSLVHIREDHMPVGEAIIESVKNRIRPIFMTTLGGLVGLFPLVIAPGAGSELYRGIGAVLLGGLLVSTVVTLVFVPALLGLTMEIRESLLRILFKKRHPDDDDDSQLDRLDLDEGENLAPALPQPSEARPVPAITSSQTVELS